MTETSTAAGIPARDAGSQAGPSATRIADLERRADILPPAPLLPSEDLEEYHKLFSEIVQTVGPRDAIELLWVRHYTTLEWEISRGHRFKAALVQLGRRSALGTILIAHGVSRIASGADDLARRYIAGDSAAVAEVQALFDSWGLKLHHVEHQAFLDSLPAQEILDKLVASRLAMQITILNELQRRRVAAAQLRNLQSRGSSK